MTFHATDRMGSTINEPSAGEMKHLLESLSRIDLEHPDVSLNHESEWCISVFESGLAVFEKVDSPNGLSNLALNADTSATATFINLIPSSIGYQPGWF